MIRTQLALAALIVGSAVTVESQDTSPGVFRVTAELVQFEARFLDRNGRVVRDIEKHEVTLQQGGETVPIADIRFEARAVRATETAPAGQSAIGIGAQRPHTQDPAEAWIVLVDDLAMSPDAFARTRSGLLAMMESGVPVGTEMGLLRTGELGQRTTKLSSDRGEIVRVLSEMRYASNRWRGGRMSRSGATGAGSSRSDRIFLEGTLGSLNSLMAGLRQLAGRKVIIVLSEFIALTGNDLDQEPGGLGITPSNPQYAQVADRLRRLGRLAAEAGVTVHTVDVGGGSNLGSRERATVDEGLHAVADELGGVYFGNSNDVGELLSRLLQCEEGHYILSYVPPEGTFGSGGKAGFVPLKVVISRPGVVAHTRSGFFTR
ncbi:VWA domain-containing protein [Luteitalea sp.]